MPKHVRLALQAAGILMAIVALVRTSGIREQNIRLAAEIAALRRQIEPGVAAPASSAQRSPAPPYVGARPIRQTQPVLPASVRRLIPSVVEVDVKVRIDEAGRVVKAAIIGALARALSFAA